MIQGLQTDPPSLSNISADCIRNADMPALIETGVSNQQLLAVWSTNADTGFTIDQLLDAGIPLSQMYTGGIPGYILFNEACNTPLSVGTAPDPTIRLISTNLNSTDTNIVLEGSATGSLAWAVAGNSGDFNTLNTNTKMIGSATAVLISLGETTIVSTLSLPFDYVFSNLTVRCFNSQFHSVSIQLCPGR